MTDEGGSHTCNSILHFSKRLCSFHVLLMSFRHSKSSKIQTLLTNPFSQDHQGWKVACMDHVRQWSLALGANPTHIMHRPCPNPASTWLNIWHIETAWHRIEPLRVNRSSTSSSITPPLPLFGRQTIYCVLKTGPVGKSRFQFTGVSASVDASRHIPCLLCITLGAMIPSTMIAQVSYLIWSRDEQGFNISRALKLWEPFSLPPPTIVKTFRHRGNPTTIAKSILLY